MKEQVETALEKIRPMLQADGGIVKVKLTGACKGCPMSQITLKNGIERILMKEVSEVKAVESV
jgi:Fe-S cluster biogenesis protein NfuA